MKRMVFMLCVTLSALRSWADGGQPPAELAGRVNELERLVAELRSPEHELWADARYGFKPNDPAFDNGELLTRLVRERRIDRPLFFPGGLYYHSTPCDWGRHIGGPVVFGAGQSQMLNAAAYRPGNSGGFPTIFVYTGDAQQAAHVFSGNHAAFYNVAFQCGDGLEPPATAGTGFQVTWRNAGIPSGKIDFHNCAFLGWGQGVFFTGPTHADNVAFSGLTRWHKCAVCLAGDNGQANGMTIQQAVVNSCGTFIDAYHFGGVSAQYVKFNGIKLILHARKTNSNTCRFVIQDSKFDNYAAGWRLVEMDEFGPLSLKLHGHLGKYCPWGERPIRLPPNRFGPHYYDLDVRLWRGTGIVTAAELAASQ